MNQLGFTIFCFLRRFESPRKPANARLWRFSQLQNLRCILCVIATDRCRLYSTGAPFKTCFDVFAFSIEKRESSDQAVATLPVLKAGLLDHLHVVRGVSSSGFFLFVYMKFSLRE